MKLKIEESKYNGTITKQVKVTKYNADTEEGLKRSDYVLGKLVFEPIAGSKVRDSDTKFSKKGSVMSWFFGVVNWFNADPSMDFAKNEYGSYKFDLGQCKSEKGVVFTKEDEFVCYLKPFTAKDGKEKTYVAIDKVSQLEPKQAVLMKKIMEYNNSCSQEEKVAHASTIPIEKDNGEKENVEVSKLLPYWIFVLKNEDVLRYI